MMAFNVEIDLPKLEELSKGNMLSGDLAHYNDWLCPVCGNSFRTGQEFQEGLHENCIEEVML